MSREELKLNVLRERSRIASELMSSYKSSGDYLISSKWLVDKIIGGKEKNRMVKISNIVNGR